MTSEGYPQDDPWIEKQVADMVRQIEVFELPQRPACRCSTCKGVIHSWMQALARHLVVNQPENLVHPALLEVVKAARVYMDFRGESSLTATAMNQVIDVALEAVEAVGLPLVISQEDDR